ncbi:MAG: response regulator [Gemmatimonadales bacterium]
MASSKTVLIVENDADARFAVGAVLNHDGYHVEEAPGGERGVALARELLPDLILMDINMPGMDGLEAAERIRADERTRHIPIVALTGERLADRTGARRAGQLFHSILWKPMTPTKLMAHIRGIIGDP